MIKKILKMLMIIFELFHYNKNIGIPDNKSEEMLKKLREFYYDNYKINYKVLLREISYQTLDYKFVGGIVFDNNLYLTPNKAPNILMLNKNFVSKVLGELTYDDYKWTGECVYKDKLYFFPRKQNNLLVCDKKGNITEIKGKKYREEHHYGGINWKHYVIQPPRNTSHFLVWDLEDKTCKTIKICPSLFLILLRYNCSILHPNGYIYFFPENGRIIKFNPENFKWCFIGNRFNTMIFDAKIGLDGNIYGYSIYGFGIVKLNIKDEIVEILYPDIAFDAYGTKLGSNCKIYSIPGHGESVWEFDPVHNILNELINLNDAGYAKFAGGTTTHKGKIIGVPSFSNKILELCPTDEVEIPREIYDVFWSDCY